MEFFQNNQQLHVEVQHYKIECSRLKEQNQKNVTQKKELEEIINGFSQKEKQLRQMKAALADSKFELRKLEEDIATQRTKAEMDRIKSIKAYEQKIKQQKQKMQHDNQDWINRFDIQQKQFKQNITKLQIKLTLEAEEQMKAFQQKTESQILALRQQKNSVIQKLQSDIVVQQQQFLVQKQRLIKQTTIKLYDQIKTVKQKTTNDILKKQRQYQVKLSMVENERKNEVSQHENTKKQFGTVKDTLYQQIYKLTTYKDDLEQQVRDFKTQIEQKTKKIIMLNNSIKQLQTKHDNQIKTYMENSKKNLQNIQNKSTGDVQQILKHQLLYVETMQHKIQSLQQKHLEIMKQYKTQLAQMRLSYDQRPSKTQDIQLIRTLKQKLRKKEHQYQYLQDEIKWFRLEVNNKDDMYTKLFAGGYTMADIKSAINQNHNSNNQRGQSRSPQSRAQRGDRGQYKTRRIGRSLIMKRKGGDQSRTQNGSVLQNRNHIH